MGDLEKQAPDGKMEDDEEEKLVLDFDMLCSTVALQTQGKWRKLETADFDANGANGGEFGGVFRMWEGEVLDCFDDRRIAIESLCCPCYRFGKNMRRTGFGSCFVQGTESSLDDFVYHIFCPCCALSQESRTLEMNNVQDGTWHGRGDTICIGSISEGNKAIFELHPPSILSIKSTEICSIQHSADDGGHS